jgi:uncharacterized coiled-coil protein SlyX
MAIPFLTSKAANEQIAGLNARISELEADAVERDAALSEANDQVAAHAQTITDRDASIATLTSERDAALAAQRTAEAAAAEANAKLATFDDEVEQRVIAKVASLGTGAVTVTGSSEGGETKTRAEFSALDAKGRAEFLRNGGKLKD